MSGNSAPDKVPHLCVLIHGFWGDPQDLQMMANMVREKHAELHILITKSNSGNFTYDGIELGGERASQEILGEIESLRSRGHQIKRLSFVGYSLGGLVARYAIGLFESMGIFKHIQPMNFTTFVTPHLGVRAPLRGWHNSLWNVLGARTLLTSGQQLFMIDKFRETGRPLLEILADSNSIFMQGLAKFKRRTLYANIVNDRSAVYYTTSISKTDPFTNLERIRFTYLKGYEDILLDPDAPLGLPEELGMTFCARVLKTSETSVKRFPFFVALAFYVPIGLMTVLVNSGIEALRSNHRIRLYEQGRSDIDPDTYRVPLLISGIQEAVDDVYKNVNSAQSHEYLEASSEEALLEGPSSLRTLQQDDWKSTLFHQPDIPILALTSSQFGMIQSLDNLGWHKFPVHIHKHRHSHAAIIVRKDKPSFAEGMVVIRHWLEEEFIV